MHCRKLAMLGGGRSNAPANANSSAMTSAAIHSLLLRMALHHGLMFRSCELLPMICWFALVMASLIHAYNLVWVATRLSEATLEPVFGGEATVLEAVFGGCAGSHGTLIVHCRFAHMSLLEIVTHVEALIFAAFGILISLGGIASLWAFRKIGRLAS